jgi:hypothetical protein
MKGIVQCSENYQKKNINRGFTAIIQVGIIMTNLFVASLFRGDDKFFWHAWSNSPYKIM